MIILATAVVITLNNSGIIGNANKAVDVTNLAGLKTYITTSLLLEGWYERKNISADTFEGYLRNVPEANVTKVAEDTWRVTRE